MTRWRIPMFVFVVVVCVVGAAVVIVRGTPDAPSVIPPAGASDTAAALTRIQAQPHVLFRETRVGDRFGSVALADPDRPDEVLAHTDLQCERVHFAKHRGLCLQASRGAVTTYHLRIFDERFTTLFTRDLPGLPSRARVSPDGTRGAMTTFVSGDSYLSPGQFSTRTEILDLRTGESLGDLEQFTVLRDGQPFKEVDFNFWGVTFLSDANQFYATLQTGGMQYLVKGDAAARQASIVRSGVECPSLSPDGTRVAFKKREDAGFGRVAWRLSVLDLATLQDHPLAETRNVDDQAIWFDNDTVLYAVPKAAQGTPTKQTLAVNADGSGTPRVLVDGADSLATVRP